MKKCNTPPKLEQKSNFGGLFKLVKYDYVFKNKVVKAYQIGEMLLSNTGKAI